MTPDAFESLIAEVTAKIAGREVGPALAEFLNSEFPADGKTFAAIEAGCRAAIAAGWMCGQEAGGIRYGRVIKPGERTHGFSVDVVQMRDVKGPHHRHPTGEIDMIMPITPGAKFDGQPKGWHVYEPDSAHNPTVSDGEALVLYLLPDGKIEFTRR